MGEKKLCKIESQKKIEGVCAGLAYYFDIDVTIIRVLWLLAVFFGVGSPILIYIILAIVLPNCEPEQRGYYEDDERY